MGDRGEETKGRVPVDVATIGVRWGSSGWDGTGVVKMSPEAGSWRTIPPFYIVHLFILEKHLLFKILFSETF